MKINPKSFTHNSKIILHESGGGVAISPNNNSFLLNVNNQIVSFYYLCQYKGKDTCVTYYCQFNLFNSSYLPSNKYLNICESLKNGKIDKERFVKEIMLYLRKYRSTIYSLLDQIYSMKNLQEINYKKEIFLKINEIIDGLSIEKEKNQFEKRKIYLTDRFIGHVSQLIGINNLNICEKFSFEKITSVSCSESESNLIDWNTYWYLLSKYFKYEIYTLETLFDSTYDYLGIKVIDDYSDIDKEINEYVKDIISKDMLLSQYVKESDESEKVIGSEFINKDLLSFIIIETDNLNNNIFKNSIRLLEDLINLSLTERDSLIIGITNLSPFIAEYLFYHVWEYKGSIEGIHSDFGRLAFIGSSIIPGCYLLNSEELIDVLMFCISKFEMILKYDYVYKYKY